TDTTTKPSSETTDTTTKPSSETTDTTTKPTSETTTRPSIEGTLQERLKKVSVVNPIYVGSQQITGKTLPNTKISYRLIKKEKTKVTQLFVTEKVYADKLTTVDSTGQFKLAIEEKLTEGDKVVVTFINEQAKVEVTKEVEVAKATKGKVSKILPQTGEKENYIGLTGFIVIGFAFILRRRKVN
ncbi:LPXTG cell wall anchor domain-containing protein, partial [Vagococcus sp.]|uniref:LPXTG cell wall anchor domain-containing protein n=1 Tax=Vagococcus sp. TaxID=1933889 RepID=UPI003F9A920B